MILVSGQSETGNWQTRAACRLALYGAAGIRPLPPTHRTIPITQLHPDDAFSAAAQPVQHVQRLYDTTHMRF